MLLMTQSVGHRVTKSSLSNFINLAFGMWRSLPKSWSESIIVSNDLFDAKKMYVFSVLNIPSITTQLGFP